MMYSNIGLSFCETVPLNMVLFVGWSVQGQGSTNFNQVLCDVYQYSACLTFSKKMLKGGS